MNKRTQPHAVREMLERIEVRPNRFLGQNFLIDANILDIILETAEVGLEDTVLEIGPGLGVLTEPLTHRARRVIAIEKDRRLAAWLAEDLGRPGNLELIAADAADFDLEACLSQGVTKLVANLPYSIGSRALMDIVRSPHRPRAFTVMHQHDVALRLVAGPGGRAYGLLSVWTQLYYNVAIRKTVSPTCFFPPPAVRSAVLHGTRREPEVVPEDPEALDVLLKASFSRRRKQLQRILKACARSPEAWDTLVRDILPDLGLEPSARPETIEVAFWVRLANAAAPYLASGRTLG